MKRTHLKHGVGGGLVDTWVTGKIFMWALQQSKPEASLEAKVTELKLSAFGTP